MTRVLVLGGPGQLTRTVVERLRSSPQVTSCEPVDPRQGAPEPPAGGVDCAVYLAAALGRRGRPEPAERARAAFAALAAGGVRSVVVVSSAAVFPPRHAHAGLVPESHPPQRGVNEAADAWAALEAEAVRAFGPGGPVTLTVLRPAAVPTRDGADYFSRLLRGRYGVIFLGHDPSLQLLAVEDLAEAVALSVERARPGTFHLAPSSVVPVRRALRFSGTWRLRAPAWAHRLGRRLLAPFGVAPWADAERIRYSWTVSGEAAREQLGFEPRLTSAEVAAAVAGREPPDRSRCGYDDFGRDERYVRWLHRTTLGFLHQLWWRVELAGLEHVPRERAVLAGVHRGFMPFDGTMLVYGLVRKLGLHPRFLIHHTLVKEAFLGDFITKQGGVVATRRNADLLLQRGELVGFFPEGVEGAFSYYREAYRLRRDFGRDEFVKTAVRNRVPIVPFVTVGSVEIFPVLAKIDWGWWKRYTEWPCFPIAPPFPLLPFPLPSKWHTLVLEPIPVQDSWGPEAARDRELVSSISEDVRRRMQAALDELRARRRWIFFGSILGPEMEGDARAAAGRA